MTASQTLARLLGLGGSIYGQREHLHQHDLLVRERAAGAVLEAAAALRGLAVAYRRDRVPAPTRERPYAPPEALQTLNRLEEAVRATSALADAIRNLGMPSEDLVWERLRTGSLQLELLTEADLRLIALGEELRDAARDIPDGRAADAAALDGLAARRAALEQAVSQRRSLLLFPG